MNLIMAFFICYFWLFQPVTLEWRFSTGTNILSTAFSESGKHNFVPVGSERDINSSVKNVIEWIGLFIGFAAGVGCMIMKFVN